MSLLRRWLPWAGLLLILGGAAWAADRALHPPDTFEVNYDAAGRPIMAIVDLYGGPTLLDVGPSRATGQRRIGRDDDGRVFVVYRDGHQVECQIGYVTPGARQHWRFWVKDGRCGPEPPPWPAVDQAAAAAAGAASAGRREPFNCPTKETYFATPVVCGDRRMYFAPDIRRVCKDRGGVLKLPPMSPKASLTRCFATGQAVHGAPGPCRDRMEQPILCTGKLRTDVFGGTWSFSGAGSR